MADSKSGVHVLQLKPITVPPSMIAGEKFIKWDEDSSVVTPVTLRVDPDGYFLYWTDQNDETRFLDLCSIRDTRTGRYAKVPKDVKMREQLMMGPQDLLEDKTLTVVHGPDFVNVYFVQFCATKKEIAKFWTEELLKMAYNILSYNGSILSFLRKAYVKLTLSVDKSGKIPLKNVIRLFAQHKDDRRRVEKALETLGFTTAKEDGILKKSEFQFEHFYQLCKLLTGRSEVKEIFDNLCASKGSAVDLDQFMEFLNQHQRDPRLNELLYPYANPSRALDLINQYEPNEGNAQQGLLSEEGLLRFLLGDDNSIISSDKIDLSHDMDQPLCHYFINSSHNTYLTGHQITGKSSVEIYRQALLAGCRCVELDFWNGKNDEPIIYHGYTLVPEVPAKDVIEAIAESAFKSSEFPVILSFENHCNTKQQAKIAQYCREFFGEMLLDAALISHPLEPGVPLPSPSSLKRKIIIKNKKKPPSQGKKSEKIKADSSASAAQANGEGSRPPLEKRESRDSTVDDGEEVAAETEDAEVGSDCDDEDDVTTLSPEELRLREKAQKDKGTAGKETQAGSEISALVNYVQPIHFQSFESAERRDRSYEMSSFVESQAMALLKEHPVEFVNYNKRQLSRIYPKGTRVDSSNFLPQVFWNAGCQLVALNFQTLDLAMQLNLGIFECNGRSGYLLKPQFMRRPDRRFDPFAESMVDGIIAGTVSVQVISGQFLSDKRVSTYVEVDMFGLPADTVRKRFRTKTVFNNGINPQYNEEPFEFKKVILPELACIRISAYEDSGRLIGHRVFPVTGLCPGYRHLLLRSETGQPLSLATLFVKIVVKDYVPDKLSMLAEALVNPIKYQSELEKRAKQLSVLMADSEDAAEDSPDGYFTDLSKSLSSPGPWTSPSSASGGSNFSFSGPTSPKGDNTDTLSKKRESSKKPLTPRVSLDDPAGPSSAPTSPPRTAEPLELVFNVETPEQLMEHKAVKKLKEKLQKKLEELRKEYEKEKKKLDDDPELVSKNKAPNKLIRRFSNSAMLDRKSSVQGRSTPEAVEQMKRQLAEKLRNDEKEQRKKYRDSIYATLEECIAESQRQQLRLLKKQHDALVNEAQKTVLAQIKTEFENINRKYSNKDEVNGARREKRDEIIKKSVAERERLQKQFAEKKEELERQFDQLRRAFQEEKSKNLLDLENGDHSSSSPSDNTDPPVDFGALENPIGNPKFQE